MTTKAASDPVVHETHLVSRHGPFCEKCSARRLALTEPCRIPDDPQDRAERDARRKEVPRG